MAELTGSEIIAKCLKAEGVKDLFYIMGGPMLLTESKCIDEGIRMIDVRHEQAAAFAAQAYSRVTQRPGVCMAASGPAAINLSTGLANALIDCCPVVGFGGSSPAGQFGRQVFQEIDQVAIMEGCVKYADRLHQHQTHPAAGQFRVPDRACSASRDRSISIARATCSTRRSTRARSIGAMPAGRSFGRAPMPSRRRSTRWSMRSTAPRQPIICSGGGVIWSQAWNEMRQFVEKAGIPFYTTPQGRGVVPDDHPYSYLTMRSTAFRDADLIIILGTRMNYVIGHAAPPRFGANAKIARIEIDAEELGRSARNVDIPVLGDCKSVLEQLIDALGSATPPTNSPAGGRSWPTARPRSAPVRAATIRPTATSTRCGCARRSRISPSRDAILCVDGQEILNYGRQSMPTFEPGHRLNSGPFGTMGVGLPFAVGAKAGKPDKQVICVHGDGSFGLNAMELDTAVRHKLPILVVISLNGGWTADPQRNKPGRDLGYTRYDKMAEGLGCYSEYVEQPEEIRPALERAQKQVDEGRVALVNVKTDYRARAGTVQFSDYST